MKKYLVLTLSLIFLLSCAEKTEESQPEAATEKKMSPALKITGQWVRTAAEGRNTALFFKIENGTDLADTLVNAGSDAAELVEIHETYKKSDDMMGMRQIEFLPVPAKSVVELKPRGLHVMFIKLKKDLAIGDTVAAKLSFKVKGEIELNAVVKEMPMMKKMKH